MMAWLAALGGVSALATALWIPRLPEPPAGVDGIHAHYGRLSGAPFAMASALLGAGAGATLSQLPDGLWPVGLGFAGPGAALALTDLRTTFLPLPVTRLCWALSAIGLGITLAQVADPAALTLRVALAALATTALLWLFWRLGGLGFGDVRLAPMVALVPATVSLDCWYRALLLGSLAGALGGLAVALWRRRHPSPLGTTFAYGPALWLGPWLALATG